MWNNPPARSGLSLLELLLGVIIFSLAMLPLFSMTQSTTQGAYSIRKHLVASQICVAILDRLLSMPFDEAQKFAQDNDDKEFSLEKDGESFLRNAEVKAVVSGLPAAKAGEIPFVDGLEKALLTMKYKVKMTVPAAEKEKDVMILLTVAVSWNVVENEEKSRQTIVREALRFKEDV